MERKRKAYAPFSQTSEAGVAQTPVEGYIDVNQTIYPTVNTGVVNEKGQWSGVKSSDTEFRAFTKHVAVANGGETLSPDTGTENFIDMTGFDNIFIALKVSRAGSYQITAVMGPDTNRFANLNPIAPAVTLRGNWNGIGNEHDLETLFHESGETINENVWYIYPIQGRLSDQKLMQFKITNDSGGSSDIEFAYLRTVGE